MLGKANILVVDDEKNIREGCEGILSGEGCAVATAPGGKEGLEFLAREKFDLVLLDLKMPKMDGMDVLSEISRMESPPTVIVITGYATVESAVEAMKRGAYDYIPKPFSADELCLVVGRAIDMRRLAAEAERLRRAQEKSLKDIATEKGRLRTVVASMAGGVLVVDSERKVVLHNPAAQGLLGMREDALVGLSLSECLGDERLDGAVAELLAGMGELCHVSEEVAPPKAPGSVLLVQVKPVRVENGDVLGAVATLQDITDLKALDKMRSEFVGMVSHELRSPLASIEQQLAVILADMVGEVPGRQREILSRAKEKTNSLLGLINDLLDISRIEAGVVAEKREDVDISEVLQKVVELLEARASAKALSLGLSAAPGLVVKGDSRNFEQVFTNIIVNAVNYTPEGGKVSVSAREEDGWAVVTVADTGIGIPEESIPKIFEKFYRVKSPQTRHVTGTGLGLPIAKGIVESYGGRIEVSSQLGKGSVFTIRIP